MARLAQHERISGRTILLVDDNANYLEITRRLLQGEGHQTFTASNGPEALELLRKRHMDLLLLDYFMPGMTGEEVVVELRKFDPHIQIILQTGYASECPPRELLRRLDVQGYFDKSEGPNTLLLWVDVGLKAAYTVQMLRKSREGLRYILNVTPDLHKIQPLDDLLQGILLQVSGLLGAVNSFLAVLPVEEEAHSQSSNEEGFVAVFNDRTELTIRAGTGRFADCAKVNRAVEEEILGKVCEAMRTRAVQVVDNTTIVPLRVGDRMIGVVYLDRPTAGEDMELLHVFANQAAVAVRNSQLYETATLDHLTGVFSRGFIDECLLREIRVAFRSQNALSLMMVDLDGLKKINDVGGHLAGDQALAAVGKILRHTARGTDAVGRYGGDEFAVILPDMRLENTGIVGDRILALTREQKVSGPDGDMPLQVSIGVTSLSPHAFAPAEIPRPTPNTYFREMATLLTRHADKALYQAKREGKNRLCCGAEVQWAPMDACAEQGNNITESKVIKPRQL